MKMPRFVLSALFSVLTAVAVHATIGTSLQMQLGNPSAAAVDPSNHAHYLIERPQYALDYNDTTHEPNWVSWDLTSSDVGGSGRSPDFFVDTTLPAGFYQVQTTDYSGSGFDRGHMCPSGDRTLSRADNDVTFFMSNMVPQTPDNNQGVWANFESYSRSLASAGNELLIISGTSGFAGSTIASGVAIPGYTWKIVVVVPLGPGSAVDRIVAAGGSGIRVITIKVPNIAGVRSTPWENFVTSPAQIQADTGYTFFTALPGAIASSFRNQIDGSTPSGAPTITSQPNTQTTVVGGSATFSVTAVGDAPLTYQWLHDDNDVIGATSSTLTLNNVQAADVGTYFVEVTNSVGSATSNAASLIVTGLPPSITTSPASQTVNAGVNVTFAVTASGSPTLTYQWRKAGMAIGAATQPTLSLLNVQAGDAASYDVVVTNSVGSAVSAAAFLAVNPAAPTITGQPASRTATTGDNASFTVAASGSAPLTYQWRKDGSALANGGAISGANAATLLLTGVAVADAGSYDVVVTNSLGSATSAAATLTVNAAPPASIYWDFGPATAMTANPTSGLTADISGGTVTSGNSNGTTTLLGITSASTPTTTFSGATNAGVAARIGALNKATGGSAYFEFTLTPAAGKRLVVSSLSFGARSTSTAPKAYSVFSSVDGFTAPLATGTLLADSVWRMLTPTFTSVTGATGTPVTFRLYGFDGTGSPGAGTINWRIDDLRVTANAVFPAPATPAVVSTSPVNGATGVAVTSPITVTFNEAVTVGGSWFSITSALNGPIAASVNGGPVSFTLSPPSALAYNDTITVTIFGGQVADQATGTILGTANTTFSYSTEIFVPPSPPTITGQPASQTVFVGANVTFDVTASGTAPLSYQWRKNGTAITGNSSATTASLSLGNVATTDAGNYSCVVSNSAGSNVSNAASLTVNLAPPTITSSPTSQFATVGGNASFTVGVSGSGPFTYQWRRNGAALTNGAIVSGATGLALTLTGVTHAESGSYDVVVTNAAGSATSDDATFAVTDSAPGDIYWNFTTASPTSGIPAGVAGGTFTQGNNNGTTTLLTTTSASGTYAGASGGNNVGAAARIGALNQGTGGSAYFEFTFTPDAGRQFAATSLSFGARSTSTGPKAYAVFTSADGFATPVASGTFSSDSVWRMNVTSFSGVTGAAGEAVTFRIFGFNGTGSPGAGTANWRLDDVRLTAGVLALPPVPPSFTTAPADQTVTSGDDVSFSVAVAGTAPFSFQWLKDSAAITGNASATTSTLSLTGVTTAAAGSYTCRVTNIAGVTTSPAATLTVNKAAASVTLGDLSFVYNGSPIATTATTNPAGLNVVITYDGSATAPTNAGNYAVVATVDESEYDGLASGTLVIAKAPASVSLSGLNRTYDGSPKFASASTSPAGLGVALTYDGGPSAPTNAGSYSVTGTIIDANFFGSASGTLTIAKATATISISGQVQAYDGSPKSVTVATTPANLTVVVTYNGNTTAPTNPGSYAVAVTVNDANYSGSASDTLTISVTALVRHAPSVSGGLDGSVQVLLPETAAFNGNAYISGDLLVPGTPTIKLNGNPVYGGTIDGSGTVSPSTYTVTLSGNALVRHIVRRTTALTMPVVATPPAPAGTRNVSLTSAGQSAGDFATLRNLSLSGNAGSVAVPAGTYGTFTLGADTVLVLGVAGGTEPVVYNLQSLALNGNSRVDLVGPVIINVAGDTTVSGSLGSAAHPSWLTLNLAAGGLTLNGGATCDGFVTAPNGTVTINGNSTLTGGVASDRLTINGSGLLTALDQ